MQSNVKQLYEQIKSGSFLALARGITIVENELDQYESLLLNLRESGNARVIGITGPPGAGKSTLVNALLHHWLKENKKIAVIAVDPSSPFNYGALLGDRIRMSEFYTHPNIFIRSLATRGALGGLSAKIIEITDLVKDAPFDLVLVETVGVGQSEVEIAGLADCTVVTLVPEAGDEVQTIKAGIMEIANIFVVNKADRLHLHYYLLDAGIGHAGSVGIIVVVSFLIIAAGYLLQNQRLFILAVAPLIASTALFIIYRLRQKKLSESASTEK